MFLFKHRETENFLILNKKMKELFLIVWHCVPLPAAAKPLAVSELPPAACQHQDTSDGCRNSQKAKTPKTICNLTWLFFLFSPDKGVTRRSRVQGFKRYGRRCLHIKTMSLEALQKSERLMTLSGVFVVFVKNKIRVICGIRAKRTLYLCASVFKIKIQFTVYGLQFTVYSL